MDNYLKGLIEKYIDIEEYLLDMITKQERFITNKGDSGLSCQHQFDALNAIAFLDIHNVTGIAETICISKSATSIMLKKMANQGLIRKIYGYNADDNRSIYIEITSSGVELIQNYMRDRVNNAIDFFNSMSPNQKTDMIKIVKYFNLSFDECDGTLIEITRNLVNESDCCDDAKEYCIESSKFITAKIKSDKPYLLQLRKAHMNMTPQQFAILKAIADFEKNTVSKLVADFGTSVSTVSINVSRLVKAGYVKKEYCKTGDGRVTLLTVTEKARQEMEQIDENKKLIFCQKYNSLNDEQKQNLKLALEHLKIFISQIRLEAKL